MAAPVAQAGMNLQPSCTYQLLACHKFTRKIRSKKPALA
jgi:hypothetical protein